MSTNFSEFLVEERIEKKGRRRIDHREKIIDRQVLSSEQIEHQPRTEPRVENIENEVR